MVNVAILTSYVIVGRSLLAAHKGCVLVQGDAVAE
jgi:hypothetical protein